MRFSFGRHIGCILLICYSLTNYSKAQSPVLNQPREIGIFGSLALWTGVNYAIQFRSQPVPSRGNSWKIAGLDGKAKTMLNAKAVTISDLSLLGTGVLCGLSVLSQNRSTTWSKGVVMAQSTWMAVNFTHSIKMIAQRNRPYTQAPGFQYSKRDDVYSFFSGHSAMASCMVTSAFLMYKDPKSFNGQKIWLAGGVLAGLTTMYLRFYAGKHYPSDILAGLISGIGIACINYYVHKT